MRECHGGRCVEDCHLINTVRGTTRVSGGWRSSEWCDMVMGSKNGVAVECGSVRMRNEDGLVAAGEASRLDLIELDKKG